MRSTFGQTSRIAILAVLAGWLAAPALAQSEDAGFGKDIPLGMAVKRLAPAGTEVRMGPGVDPNAKVTWSGGGWRDALGGAARGAGYAVSVKGDSVEISKAGSRVVTTESAGEPEAGALGTERSAGRRPEPRTWRAPARAERAGASRAERRREARTSRRHEARAPARHERAPVRRERLAEAGGETVSGGGFVMLPVRSEAPPRAEAPVRKAAWREPAAVDGVNPAPAAPAGLAVQEGDNLQAVLGEWCGRNGWRLVWNSEFSYRLSSAARFQGGFEEAATELLKSMRAVRPLVTASFFKGNKTLVVGNDSSDAAGGI